MPERVPAPDGRMAADGSALSVLPDGTMLNFVYEVSYLTAGGMGIVYKGKKDNETCCVKEVECSKLPKIMALTQEKAMLERLNHPGIVKVLDCFDEDGYLYIVLEFIEGKSLGEIVHIGGSDFIEESLLYKWSLQLYDIFEYLHSQNPPIIYRDLKPQNVMCRPDGRLCLIDFGIARVHKESKVADTYSMGTALTASPEHYGGRQTDVRSDIFTLGATLHYLSTNGKGVGRGFFEFIPVRTINPALSENFESLIVKALQVHPEDRFQTVREMREAHISSPPTSMRLVMTSSDALSPSPVKTPSQISALSQTAASQTTASQTGHAASVAASHPGPAISPLFMRIPPAVVAAVFVVVSAVIFLWAVLILHSDQRGTADPKRGGSGPVADLPRNGSGLGAKFPGTRVSFKGCSAVMPPGYQEIRRNTNSNVIEYRKKDDKGTRSLEVEDLELHFSSSSKVVAKTLPTTFFTILSDRNYHNETQIRNKGNTSPTPYGFRLDNGIVDTLSDDEEQAEKGIQKTCEVTVLVPDTVLDTKMAYVLIASADKKSFNLFGSEFKSFFESLTVDSKQ